MSAFRELNSRESDGITVSFLYRDNAPNPPDFKVHVSDSKTGADFTIEADTFEVAHHAYYHPMVAANRALVGKLHIGTINV